MNPSAIIHDQVVVFSKSLAKLVGVHGAVIIQQIRFALSQPRSGVILKDEKWVWNTYEDWQRDWFPFWSAVTIRRAFKDMEGRGFIMSCQPDGHMSRKKYYRLNEGMVAKLTIQAADEISPPSDQIDRIEEIKMIASLTDTSQIGRSRSRNAREKNPKALLTRPTQLPLGQRRRKRYKPEC